MIHAVGAVVGNDDLLSFTRAVQRLVEQTWQLASLSGASSTRLDSSRSFSVPTPSHVAVRGPRHKGRPGSLTDGRRSATVSMLVRS